MINILFLFPSVVIVFFSIVLLTVEIKNKVLKDLPKFKYKLLRFSISTIACACLLELIAEIEYGHIIFALSSLLIKISYMMLLFYILYSKTNFFKIGKTLNA